MGFQGPKLKHETRSISRSNAHREGVQTSFPRLQVAKSKWPKIILWATNKGGKKAKLNSQNVFEKKKRIKHFQAEKLPHRHTRPRRQITQPPKQRQRTGCAEDICPAAQGRALGDVKTWVRAATVEEWELPIRAPAGEASKCFQIRSQRNMRPVQPRMQTIQGLAKALQCTYLSPACWKLTTRKLSKSENIFQFFLQFPKLTDRTRSKNVFFT